MPSGRSSERAGGADRAIIQRLLRAAARGGDQWMAATDLVVALVGIV